MAEDMNRLNDAELEDVNGGRKRKSHENCLIVKAQPGDTLSGIAYAHGRTLQELLDENTQIKNPDLLRVGQPVYIPMYRK